MSLTFFRTNAASTFDTHDSTQCPSICAHSIDQPAHTYAHECYMNTQATKAKAKGSPKAKKPLSGYMLFAKEIRPTIKEENPEMSFGELGKELGARWRALSDEEKAEYKKN